MYRIIFLQNVCAQFSFWWINQNLIAIFWKILVYLGVFSLHIEGFFISLDFLLLNDANQPNPTQPNHLVAFYAYRILPRLRCFEAAAVEVLILKQPNKNEKKNNYKLYWGCAGIIQINMRIIKLFDAAAFINSYTFTYVCICVHTFQLF